MIRLADETYARMRHSVPWDFIRVIILRWGSTLYLTLIKRDPEGNSNRLAYPLHMHCVRGRTSSSWVCLNIVLLAIFIFKYLVMRLLIGLMKASCHP